MKSRHGCCHVKNACGYSLKQGVIYVSLSSLVICSLVLATVVLIFKDVGSLDGNILFKKPEVAINIIFLPVVAALSSYQLLLSLLLLFQVLKLNGNVFLCALWYNSHLSILVIFFVIAVAKFAVCFFRKFYFLAIASLLFCVAYEALFIYFCVIVNSYLDSLNQERWY